MTNSTAAMVNTIWAKDTVLSTGADRIVGGQGNDYISADETDTVDYSTSTGSVRINLDTTTQILGGISVSAGSALDGFGTQDTLVGVRNIIGSQYND